MAFVGFGMIVYSNASYTRVFVPKRTTECLDKGIY